MLVFGALFFASSSASALDTLALLEAGPSRVLLEDKKPIYAEISGDVPVEFSEALLIFEQEKFLQNVQEEYTRVAEEDGIPEFTVVQTSSNTYYYVNQHDERTDITEVLRRKTSDTTIDLILYSKGKRSFGKYQSLTHLQVSDNGDHTTHYTASVYAYPENMIKRFFVRHLGLIERYFKSKTDEMTQLFTIIICNMCEGNGKDVKIVEG